MWRYRIKNFRCPNMRVDYKLFKIWMFEIYESSSYSSSDGDPFLLYDFPGNSDPLMVYIYSKHFEVD